MAAQNGHSHIDLNLLHHVQTKHPKDNYGVTPLHLDAKFGRTLWNHSTLPILIIHLHLLYFISNAVKNRLVYEF